MPARCNEPAVNWGQPDCSLQVLVVMAGAEWGGAEPGVVLLVGGFLISGRVIGRAKYLDGITNDLIGSSSDETSKSIRETISKISEDVKAEVRKKLSINQKLSINEQYIHLRDALFFTANGSPIFANHGAWWRGRLSEVSGFMIGQLEPARHRIP
jgi:hypothetical protein